MSNTTPWEFTERTRCRQGNNHQVKQGLSHLHERISENVCGQVCQRQLTHVGLYN